MRTLKKEKTKEKPRKNAKKRDATRKYSKNANFTALTKKTLLLK